MRLFHISDLHLGKKLNGFSLIEDQNYILKEIIRIIDEEKPDGLIVAGDIYDRSVPSEEAMKMWDDFLILMVKRKIPVYAISGNHDSAIRVADHGRLVNEMGVHIAPDYDGSTCCFQVEDEFGKVNIYLLPFIKPINVRRAFRDEEISDYTDACRVAVKNMGIDTEQRNILVAHQFVAGGRACESEEIMVGGLDNVDTDVFDDFDYVALGHLHGAQKVGRDTLRYCGTPLKYSLSEKGHTKSITVVELGKKGTVSIDTIPLTPKRDLREIKGGFDELYNEENKGKKTSDDYIHAILTDENDVPGAMDRLRMIYPNLIKLSYDNTRTREKREVDGVADVERKTPIELFEELYEKQNNQGMSREQSDFIMECIKSVWEEGV